MTTLPSSVKLKVFLTACIGWLLAGGWLVGCVIAEAPLRMGVGAALTVALISLAVAFTKHEIEMDAIRSRSGAPARAGADDDWEKGEA